MTIFAQFDADTFQWELWCRSPGMGPMPCGPRIFRGPPHPGVEFSHATQEDAERAAQVIQKYLADLPERKISKREIQKQGA